MAQHERDLASGVVAAPRSLRSVAWTALLLTAGVGAVFWLISPPRVERHERELPPGPPDPQGREDPPDPRSEAAPTRDGAEGTDEPP